MTRFIVAPQWQGSSSSRAMQLIDGAQAIAGDLPRASCTTVEIPLEAGESVETGVLRFSTLRRTRELVDLELAPLTEPVMLIGGVRFALRALRETRRSTAGGPRPRRVLIIGAGDAGELLLREM